MEQLRKLPEKRDITCTIYISPQWLPRKLKKGIAMIILNKFDILKLDIQEAELEAFQGAVGLLERQAIQLIYTETMFVLV